MPRTGRRLDCRELSLDSFAFIQSSGDMTIRNMQLLLWFFKR